jgi:two-component system, chemotaxis family, sensor kinase CheA
MAKDPYKYFRIEARELLDGLKQGALDLEKGQSSKELVARMLRLAHTLKGAARVVRLPAIAEQAHAIEDALEPYRDGSAVPRAKVNEVLALVDAATTIVSALSAAPEDGTPVAAQPGPTATTVETVRVELDDMDRLLEGLAEATVQLNALRRETTALERTARLAASVIDQLERRPQLLQLRSDLAQVHQSIASSLAQASAELSQVREAANRLRLTPVSTVFATLERAARDAAQALGKRIDFRTFGGRTRLDAHVLTLLQDALVHVVRNAVAHGIETEQGRTAAGKPPIGKIEIRVEHRSGKVAFTCRDDGRGIDVEGLRRAAVERGVLRERAASATVEELVQLMLRGGLTTTSSVTQVAGRAIGLDVVREVIERLKGEVLVSTAPGQGTTFEMVVPVSLNSLTALVVRGGGVTGSIALETVRQTLRVEDAEIARSAHGESLLFEGKVIPFAPLAAVLGQREAKTRKRASWSTIVVEAGPSLAAIGVDQLLGASEVVVRALPAHVEAEAVVAGASLDAEGNPELVFDPVGLVEAARHAGERRQDPASLRLPILVIDDSLTTRMLEQSILESAGYEVELAVSAEEGMEKAKRARYGVFIVDVEMPGMDGFEFVARTRADPVLRDVPAILVTSRATDEDRQRGRDAGAHAYIVKGEFDQAFLLDTIQRLNG